MSRNKSQNNVRRIPNSGGGFKQGQFIPTNPGKYCGKVNNIIFRSSWELDAFKFCDNNPNIIRWSSEEIAIPYVKPTFNPKNPFRKANYFPDLYVEYYNTKGILVRELIEIKPQKQLVPSRARKTSNKIYESKAYMVNQAKWDAAREWCRQRNIRFTFMTEKDLFK